MTTSNIHDVATPIKSRSQIKDRADEPLSLGEWKLYFRHHIEEARCAVMLDRDREALIDYVKEEAGLIFYSPYLGLLDEGEDR